MKRLVFLVGGMRVIDHKITMGTLVAFIAYQMRLVWPIQALMGLYASLASARVSLRRVNEIHHSMSSRHRPRSRCRIRRGGSRSRT